MNPDYRDMLSALLEEKAEFLLVGAYALSFYGYPRATGDIDLWVHPTAENSARVYRALLKFGAPLSRVNQMDFSQNDLIFQIGVVPNRIDIMTKIDGVAFEEAWLKRNTLVYMDQTIPVIGKEQLIINKMATGRRKDELDALILASLDGPSFQ